MEVFDVLIVGSGPSGLTMALECMRYGLSCQIIDKSPKPSSYSRAIAIQARTLEIFQRMGVHTKFLDEGIRITKANIHSNHKKQAEVNLSLIQSPFPFVLSIEQNKTENILANFLSERGVSVKRETELLNFHKQDDYIIAETTKGTLHARYLIGCDGAHSTVRKAIGATFKGKTFNDVFSLADVKLDWKHSHNAISVFLESKGIVAAFPLPEENRYRLIFQLKRLRGLLKGKEHGHGLLDATEYPPPDLQEIQKLLSDCCQEVIEVSDPRWIANFHINSRLSNIYRKNNVFLVGDAAHIHSPVGGQGMNTGIQDAFNLAWKIAYVHLRKADATLLDTYEHERHTIGKKLLAATETASEFVSLHSSFLIRLRNLFLSNALMFDWVQKRLVQALSELNIGYLEPRVENYTILKDGKEYPYFTFSETSTDYHLLYHGDIKPSHTYKYIKLLQVKEALHPPILVRPDGYPTAKIDFLG